MEKNQSKDEIIIAQAGNSGGQTKERKEGGITHWEVAARSERTKLIMEAGNFQTAQEAITKFIDAISENEPRTPILYTNDRNNGNGSRGRLPEFYF